MKNYEKVQTVNLDPQTSQKSFGGRAKVTTFVTADGTLVEVLKSYETDVAAAVVRGGKSFTPDGKTVLNPGDKAIVITAGHSILDLDDILAR